jgi:hypothetical protein
VSPVGSSGVNNKKGKKKKKVKINNGKEKGEREKKREELGNIVFVSTKRMPVISCSRLAYVF